jgi:hypothetical protein
MVRDHLGQLQRLSGDMQGTFSTVLPPPKGGAGSSAPPSESGWSAAAFRLYKHAAEAHDAGNRLIAEDNPSPGRPPRALNDLSNSLADLSRAVRQFDVTFARDFENKNAIVRKDLNP